MERLISKFNSFFEGKAKAVIKGDTLEITIGSETLIISLPEIIGARSMGSLQQS